MTYTSGTHLAIKLAVGLVFLIVTISLSMSAFQATLSLGLREGWGVIPFAVVFVACLIVYSKLTAKYEEEVGAYFYLRGELETQVSFQEAKALSFLFSGENGGKWYPLAEVKKLPKEQRKQYLFDFAERVRPGGQRL
jgi:hypothetical protein